MADNGVSIQVDLVEVRDFQEALGRAKKAGAGLPIGKMSRATKKSVLQNFHVGGRPKKWAPLKNRSGTPLTLTGSLKKSVRSKAIGKYNFKIYSDHPHAPHHQFGTGLFGPKARRYPIPKSGPTRGKHRLRWEVHGEARFARRVQHPGIPARPYMMWQAEDIELMTKMVADHVVQKIKDQPGWK